MELIVISTGSKKGNCYALRASDGCSLLLDFGCRWNDIARGIDYRVSDVAGALLTHEHGDHMVAFERVVSAGIPVFTNQSAFNVIKARYGEYAIILPEKRKFMIDRFGVTPFQVPHTTRDEDGNIVPCMNYGYHITHPEMGQLVYMTDLEFSPVSFQKAKIEHLLCEVNYCEDIVTDLQGEANYSHRVLGHMGFETFKSKILLQNKSERLRTVTVCHMSDTAADIGRILAETQQIAGRNVAVNIAAPGLTVKLDKMPF